MPSSAARRHRRLRRLAVSVSGLLAAAGALGQAMPNPILFVTQVPIPADFATIGSTFANHRARVDLVGRGGDLYIRYPDGTLRNLTLEAGFGTAAVMQGATSIAVRDPHVHWDGTKALFSMVVGAPTAQFQVIESYWQIYEATGILQGQTVAITRIATQPPDYNNITPIYASDGRILFTSDRPRNGQRHLYPQLDEYESTPTNTGLWSLERATGKLVLLDHAPSGVFTPIVDSFGRVIFTRWDHLQRDQQGDNDDAAAIYGAFDYSDESATALRLTQRVEVFPEPRLMVDGSNVAGHRFNHFFPWQVNQDGTEPETLNHVGRHELHSYFEQSFLDDPSLDEFIDEVSGRFNPNSILNFFQIKEDPQVPGRFVGVEAPEFDTHASGQIVAMPGQPTLSADLMAVTYVTHPDTATVDDTPAPTHVGHFRDPLPLSDGQLLASHAAETGGVENLGNRPFPVPNHRFRIKRLVVGGGGFRVPGTPLLAAPITRNVQYFDPDVLVTYNGELWELQAVEVRARPQPPAPTAGLPALEAQVFADEEIDPAVFKADLARRGLALAVSRDVTTRDDADLQQPFNLEVPGGAQTTGDGGQVYDVSYMQLFQADQVRGMGGVVDPSDGRRVLARVLHEPVIAALTPPEQDDPPGSVELGLDGSMAALVPAHRAMTWQLTDAAGTPVVRERYWLTFQPGEIRVCASCHGLNGTDQAGQGVPVNPPEALRTLLQVWNGIFSDDFESGATGAWSTSVGD